MATIAGVAVNFTKKEKGPKCIFKYFLQFKISLNTTMYNLNKQLYAH